MENPSHIPVLRDEVVRLLAPQPGQTYFDGTAGYGGHAAAILPLLGPTGRAILVDRDEQAITALRQRFDSGRLAAGADLPQLTIINNDYAAAATDLASQGRQLDCVLLDLGVSSPQLEAGERGFSFSRSGPLDMRMDRRYGRTAADIVNTMGERELADLIYRYGEDRASRRIARAIVRQRPITTTAQLATMVAGAAGHGGRHQDIHPATRTFQALRIAVNTELQQLETALPILVRLLATGGRIAVISFHSLEDRIVKDWFRTESRDCICPPTQPVCTCDHVASLRLLTKRPLRGNQEGTQDAINPRARSAKLRAAEKLTPKPKKEAS